MKYFLSIVLAALVLVSCKNGAKHGNGVAVARVYDQYLYSSELQGMIPKGTTRKDSIEIARNFINNWIQQRLVVKKAEDNLSAAQKDCSKELDAYRNSLVVFRYESELVQQKLDTAVTEKQIEEYYNSNKENFELKDNIVKVLYVKLKAKDANVKKIRTLIKSARPADRKALQQLSASVAVNSYLDDQSWLLFSDLIKEIPIQTYDQEAYLQNHRFIEMSDDQFTYLVNFLDFKIKEGVSPLSFERDNIRNIIINKRKLKLISDMEKDVLQKAQKDKEFEIL